MTTQTTAPQCMFNLRHQYVTGHRILLMIVAGVGLSLSIPGPPARAQFCPLPAVNPWCSVRQSTDCLPTGADQTCLPLEVMFPSPIDPPTILLCDCLSGTGCGPVDIKPNTPPPGYTVSCTGGCPVVGEVCYVNLNGNSLGVSSIDSSQLVGGVVTCECEFPPPPPVCPLGNSWCAGLQSIDCITTSTNEFCLPREVTVDPTGQPIVRVCDCFNDLVEACGPVSITPNVPTGYTISCPGPCPTPQGCYVHFDGVSQGVSFIGSSQILPGTAVTCACAELGPALCPLPASAECAALQSRDCQDTTGQCLPKVIRHNIPPPFFPAAGEDVLTATTGYVVIRSPSGLLSDFMLRCANLTRVIRESPVDNGQNRTVPTEITEMELMADGGGGCTVLIRESPTRTSSGGVVGAVSANTDYPADSFFDLFVEIDIPDLGVNGLYNNDPIHLDASGITALPPLGSSFKTPPEWPGVELLEVNGDPSGYVIVEVVHECPPGESFFPPLGATDLLTSTTGHVEVISPQGEPMMYYIRESPPNTTQVIRESPAAVGGHREVEMELVEMELVGVSGGGGGGGAVQIRESPTRASHGRVVGAENAATDYPADSFFDLFVEIDIPDLGVYGLYNNAPIHLDASGITAVPPLGSSFKTPPGWLGVELLDVYGGPTGYRIREVLHELPPAPAGTPEWEVIQCACMDPGDCHVTREFSVDPTCVGGCPTPQECVQRITTGQNFVDYLCECVAPEACCFVDGSCQNLLPEHCRSIDGTPKGPGTLCLGDNSGNGIDDACEILDKVVCEPQGGLNPSHPSTYWYDVTPGGGSGRCDFHVRVYDPNPGDYTNWSMNPYPWPAGSWAFLVHQVGTEWWASWWDTDLNCSHAFFVKTRFQFDNSNASTWGDWSTTISNTSDPYNQVVDRSANHPAELDGSGYRVHVPTPPAAATQACCLPKGTCVEVEYNKCVALGGDPQGPNTICDMRVCNPLKWAQPPTYGPFITPQPPECFWGWNEHSHYQSPGCAIVADDWACTTNQPITDIHWWGSYQYWTTREPPPVAPGFPDLFHIGIWTDVPAAPPSGETCCYCYNPPLILPPTTCSPNPRDQAECDLWGGGQYQQCTYFPSSRCMGDHCETIQSLPYSHPGKMIWESIVPRTLLNERYVGCDEYPDQPPDTCFRYDFNIPQAAWFYQAPSIDPTIYWISISAWYAGPPAQPFIWGWKTREHFFNDDAVRIFAPNPPMIGSEFIEGTPIVTPDGESWDMAFVLTSASPGASKWDQWPNPDLPGLHAHDGVTLADNWECQGGLVTDFHWWGNYELDLPGSEIRGDGIQCINLSIHANTPDVPWCLPQEPALWGVCAPFSALNEHDTGMVNSEGSKIYEYTFYLDPGWPQTPGDIYWLDIEAQSINPQNPALWRWQENSRDAAPRLCPAAERTQLQAWHTIEWGPPPFRYSEMAFRVTSTPYPPRPDPSGIAKNRYLSMVVTPAPVPPEPLTALRVKLVELQNPQPPNAPCCPPKDYSAYEYGPTCTDPGGCVRWVGKPGTFLEAQDNPLGATFRGARLQCSVFYHDWGSEGVFHVTGAEIVPSSTYEVVSFAASCAGNEDTCADVSPPLRLKMVRWGDVAARFNPPDPSTQPDAIDVTILVNKFKNMAGAVIKPIAQLQPNLPELNADINALDIVAVVDAVKGLAYPFPGPCPCPSLVTCGPGVGGTACTGVDGCKLCVGGANDGKLCTVAADCPSGTCGGATGKVTGTCIKTCNGGVNAGDPCINNTHCPGSTCGTGYCRDKCARCKP